MTLVIDASVVVAALADTSATGRWAEKLLLGEQLLAPEMLLVEASNILRRLEASGVLPSPTAALAFRDLLALPVDCVSFAPCAGRVWELRHNLTSYDAWYVVVAELADAPLATLDRRLAAASGPTCRFMLP